jgi:hypothetical protein
MPYKGKVPLTISQIQPVIPGLIIDTITKEEQIVFVVPPATNCVSEVILSRLSVGDARGNVMKFVSKRSKWKSSVATSREFTQEDKARDLSGRHNECTFYLHYALSYAPLPVPRCWSIKAPNEMSVANIVGGDMGRFTSFTLLLSDMPNHVRVATRYLDYYQTVAALTYIAKFHAVFWEAKDEDGKLWPYGGHGGEDYVVSTERNNDGRWGELSERLNTMKSAVRGRVMDGISSSRKWRTVVHGAYQTSNLLMVPYVEGISESEYPDVCSTDFKKSGKGYGMLDVATLLCKSVEPGLLLVDQREEEFLGIYFNQLSASLKEARKPPLPPGYKWEDCVRGFELCVLDVCVDLHESEDGGSEYAMGRCQQLVDRLERTVDTREFLTSSQWKSVIQQQFP